MPYANNNGVKIYYEVEGEGPPLVLAHGQSRTLDSWRTYGYADALKQDFKLVLFDARGHGKSDKPHDPTAYGVKRAGDVVAVLDDLGMGKAHYFGYSMGARTGFRVATQSLSRFHSFVLCGSSPYPGEDEVKTTQDAIDGFKTIRTDPEAALVQRERLFGRSLTKEERNLYVSSDVEALIALVTARLDWPSLTNDELSHISVPCLLYCGDLDTAHDGAKKSVNHMPQATFVSLPGLAHIQAFERSDMALPHVKKFLAGVSKL